MALPTGLPTIVDLVASMGNPALQGLIDETSKATPAVSGLTRIGPNWIRIPNVGAAEIIPGQTYPTLVTTALPTVAFTDVNDGVDYAKGREELRESACYNLNPKWGVGKMLAKKHPRGWEYLMARAAAKAMAAVWQHIEKCFFYGTNATYGDAKAFPGLLQGYDATNMVVNVGGTGSALSSAWLVCFELEAVSWVWGANGKLDVTDPIEVQSTGANSKPMTIHHQELFAFPGLKFVSQTHVVRIKNIGTGSKALTDYAVSDALAKFSSANFPSVIFMSRRTLSGLQQTRLPVNAEGKPAPIPVESHQVPIAVSEMLSDAETTSV